MSARDFRIDPEVQSYLPRLTDEERAQLALLIETDRHVDPLVVLNVGGDRVLGDGHNRLAICEEKGVPYTTREIKLPSRELALQWVIDNQLGRRNLTDERRSYYRGKEYLNKKQPHGGDRKGEEKSSGQNGHSTAAALADKHGVGEKTIRRDAEFAQAVDEVTKIDPAAKEAILSGASGATRQQVIDAASTPEQSLFCRPCRTNGPTKDCPACAAVRAARAGAGGAAPRGAGRRRRRKAGRKNGRELFDWKSFDKELGPVLSLPERVVRAHPAEKDSAEHGRAVQLLNELARLVKGWRAKLQKAKG
jgi:hypothetical protein